jgi:Domain of unknown function (DUF4249)
MQRRLKWILMFYVAMVTNSCREPYLPPVLASPSSYLVVDGLIKAGGDSTIIQLSRTRNLSDTVKSIPETDAWMQLEGSGGDMHYFLNLGQGRFGAPPLQLNPNGEYRLRIKARGAEYLSDFVPVKGTPSIDSLSWVRDSSLTIKVSTHDPSGQSRYYRWEYRETWEYNSFYESILGYDYSTNQPFYLDPKDYLNRCWSDEKSAAILLATTKNLTNDVVENFPVITIPEGSDKVSVRYSILVNQYALTREAFEYWQLLRKNTTELGSIFGTQPAELISNIKSVSNPQEPVIGFVSIAAVQQKRLFIRRGQLSGWNPDYSLKARCEVKVVGPDSLSYYLQRNRNLMQAYNITGGGTALADKLCIDCRLRGGTQQKPVFW